MISCFFSSPAVCVISTLLFVDMASYAGFELKEGILMPARYT